MLLKFAIVFLACYALVNAAGVLANPQQKTIKHNIDDIFMSFAEAFQSNPTLTTECFNTYGPKLQNLTEEYKASVDICQSDAEKARKAADKDIGYKVRSISSDIAIMCYNFSNCNTYDIAMNYFQCYSTTGNEGAKTAKTFSFKANEAIEFTNNRYTVIKTQFNTCTNTASDEYNLQWSILSDELEKCIKG